MKAFVYEKKESKKVLEIKDVVAVTTNEVDNTICIVDKKNRLYQYNTRDIKTTIYQN